MQLAPATIAPKPPVHAFAPASIDAPSFRPGEQPYRAFLSAASVARDHVDAAHTLLTGPQPMHLDTGAYLAKSVEEARAGVVALTRALGTKAPAAAQAGVRSAIEDLNSAISLATSPTFHVLDPWDVANLYASALAQVDDAIGHSTFMFAL